MKKNFLVTIFLFITLISLIVASWLYALTQIKRQADVITNLKKSITQNEKKINEGRDLRRLLDSLEKETKKIDSLFLAETSIVNLLEGIELAGRLSGAEINIASVSAGKGQAIKPNVSLEAKGNFNQIIDYLYFLENLPYLITIDRLSLHKFDDQDKKMVGKWQASFSLKLESYE